MAYTTIDDPSAYFKVQLYTGDGNSSKAITFDDTDTNMQPDFVWIKRRDDADSHFIYDSVRFDGSNAYWLQANNNNAQGSDRPLTAFGSDGFTIGSNNSALNGNTNTYVAWCWKEDTTAGFDIVTYTGASGDQTFAHSLGVAPEWYLVKERGNANSWVVNHIGLANQTNAYLLLNTTDAAGTDSWFNSTAPSSSVVHANDGDSPTNRNGGTYVMYLWRSVKGFSKFGSYIGNGNADGTFVYLGFRPAFVIVKRTDSSTNGNWVMHDNKRANSFNEIDARLFPNTNDAESSNGNGKIDFLSNGFKYRTSSDGQNGSGNEMIYLAFAESPFVNSKGIPTNAR